MKNQLVQKQELQELCEQVRFLLPRRAYEKCEILLGETMQKYPHSPHPHNLFGILLEDRGDHPTAMNHFRAALALDGSYKPAQHNLDYYGNFKKKGKCAYDESDCFDENKAEYAIKIDDFGVGRIIRK